MGGSQGYVGELILELNELLSAPSPDKKDAEAVQKQISQHRLCARSLYLACFTLIRLKSRMLESLRQEVVIALSAVAKKFIEDPSVMKRMEDYMRILFPLERKGKWTRLRVGY